MYRQDRGPHKPGGGLCVYIKKNYKVSSVENVSSVSDNNFQQLWLKVQSCCCKSFVICTVYRPPSTPLNFLNDLANSLIKSLLLGLDVIILGDLNCNLLQDNAESHALNDFCSTFNLTQLINKPTRVTENGDAVSKVLPLEFGVLQGSILGPVLFTIYVNDLLSVPKRCLSASYVDDCKLYLSFSPPELTTSISALNEDLMRISQWCCKNSLLINLDKTEVLAVGVPQLLQKLSSFSITLFDKELTPVPVVKDLGVLLDTCLSYNEHIKTALNCLFKLKQINRIKHLLDQKTLLLAANSFVFSKIQYCSTVWSNTSNSNIDKLQKVQNFAGQIILGLRKYDHISDGLRSLKWLPIREKLILNDATMMHKCINCSRLSC